MTASTNVLNDLIASLLSGSVRVIDLSMPLGPNTPVLPLPFPNSPVPQFTEISHYDERGPAWYWNAFTTGEHTGTHFDAPVHWITGKDLPDNCVDTLPTSTFVGPACVIDVSAEAAADDDYCLTPDRILAWEFENGRLPTGAWVLMRTDWSLRTDPADYLNARDDGTHTPGWTPACIRFLIEERDILGGGVETVGTDAGQAFGFDPPFPFHNLMHGAGKLGLASLYNLDKLPATGAVLIAPPLKLVNGSGSPLRVIALVQ